MPEKEVVQARCQNTEGCPQAEDEKSTAGARNDYTHRKLGKLHAPELVTLDKRSWRCSCKGFKARTACKQCLLILFGVSPMTTWCAYMTFRLTSFAEHHD
jgi:hypothetical protein